MVLAQSVIPRVEQQSCRRHIWQFEVGSRHSRILAVCASQFLYDDYYYLCLTVSKLSTWQDQSHISVIRTVNSWADINSLYWANPLSASQARNTYWGTHLSIPLLWSRDVTDHVTVGFNIYGWLGYRWSNKTITLPYIVAMPQMFSQEHSH